MHWCEDVCLSVVVHVLGHVVRAAADVQGVFPDIKESNYLGQRGYTVDASAPPALLDSLIYKLSYYGCACFSAACYFTTAH